MTLCRGFCGAPKREREREREGESERERKRLRFIGNRKEGVLLSR